MKIKDCYTCEHFIVCKYFQPAITQRFPFKTDHHIKGFIEGIAKLFAECCEHYKERSA